ncbi:hypothetical protein CTI12_AA035610 [Artemisia annua]|uniref:Uncharacterized protein n=1 Tax=Artemisia annua TaxID=35608 RepID=A0A2U1PNS7_ARTAN|nr:hypothetical protein CTI12_AA035610 [Artemisia annua]
MEWESLRGRQGRKNIYKVQARNSLVIYLVGPCVLVATIPDDSHVQFFGYNPSVADHPLGPATDHRLGKLLPHQLANQTRAPPRADSSFCSSAYGVLAAVSSCCSPPKGRFLRVTHPSATGNTTSRPTCMC